MGIVMVFFITTFEFLSEMLKDKSGESVPFDKNEAISLKNME